MARNSTVSIEQVADAAAQIQKLGMTPTSRNIREVVGGGSMGTILKHFQAWQSGALQPKKVISESLDASIVQSINSHIAEQVQVSRMDLTAYSTQTGHPFHGKVDSRSVATRGF